MEIKQNEDLKKWNWWKLGGCADYFSQPTNQQELQESLIWAEEKNLPVFVLGGGTNVLISDKGVRGLLISTQKLKNTSIKIEDNFLKVKAESGVLKSQLMQSFKKHQLAPALFLSGLPGDVGGGVIMNAGVGGKNFKPSEFSEIVHKIEVVTSKEIKTYSKNDIDWAYRCTSGWPKKFVIFSAEFVWPLEPSKDLNQQIKSEIKKRRQTQPLEWPSCGSVFRNPYPQHAGSLIEQAGLKGLTKGDAMVSEKHGNFIINKGQAKASDIHDLIQEIQKTIKEKFDISLIPEVHYLGDWS